MESKNALAAGRGADVAAGSAADEIIELVGRCALDIYDLTCSIMARDPSFG